MITPLVGEWCHMSNCCLPNCDTQLDIPSAAWSHQKPLLGLGSFQKPCSAGIWAPRATAASRHLSRIMWFLCTVGKYPFFQAAKPANPCLTIPKHVSIYSSTFLEMVLILKVSGILHAKIHILASKNTTFKGIKIEIIQNHRMWVLAHRRWQMAEPWIDADYRMHGEVNWLFRRHTHWQNCHLNSDGLATIEFLPPPVAHAKLCWLDPWVAEFDSNAEPRWQEQERRMGGLLSKEAGVSHVYLAICTCAG